MTDIFPRLSWRVGEEEREKKKKDERRRRRRRKSSNWESHGSLAWPLFEPKKERKELGGRTSASDKRGGC